MSMMVKMRRLMRKILWGESVVFLAVLMERLLVMIRIFWKTTMPLMNVKKDDTMASAVYIPPGSAIWENNE